MRFGFQDRTNYELMRLKVLHIIDCYLPETMNWIDSLLMQSEKECEHHIAAEYYINDENCKWKYVKSFGIKTSYPISNVNKIWNTLRHRSKIIALRKYISENSIQIVHFHFGHMMNQYIQSLTDCDVSFCCSLYGFDYEYLPNKSKEVRVGKLFNFPYVEQRTLKLSVLIL